MIFGGQGDDEIHGGTGGDIIFGDRGRVLYFDPALVPATTDATDARARSRRPRRPCSATAARATRPTASRGSSASPISVDTTLGGDDTITTGTGARRRHRRRRRRHDHDEPRRDGHADVGASSSATTASSTGRSLDGDPATSTGSASLDPDTGGSDTITTGDGDDIVIGGEDGERVVEVPGVGQRDDGQVAARTVADGDTIVAGNGRNLVLRRQRPDHRGGRRRAALRHAAADARPRRRRSSRSSAAPTRSRPARGDDIVLGGIDGDTIDAGDGNNVVLGDSGLVDWVAARARRYRAGDDIDPADIDRIRSTEPGRRRQRHDHDRRAATTSIIGGEDGELVDDVQISTHAAVTRTSSVDALRHGDTINAGDGRNLVFGDNGAVYAAGSNAARFGGLPITLGLVQTIESLLGGADSITTGAGNDIVLGGVDGDTIGAGDGNNIVIGDSGQIDWTARSAAGRSPATTSTRPTSTAILSIDPDDGGSDTITTGSGDDVDRRRRGRRDRERRAHQLAGRVPTTVADDTGSATRSTPATAATSCSATTARSTRQPRTRRSFGALSDHARPGADDRVAARRRRLDHDRLRQTTSSSAGSTATRSTPATATTS